jgi:HSP20 family protein
MLTVANSGQLSPANSRSDESLAAIGHDCGAQPEASLLQKLAKNWLTENLIQAVTQIGPGYASMPASPSPELFWDGFFVSSSMKEYSMLPEIIPSSSRSLTNSWNQGGLMSDFQRTANRFMQDFFDRTPSLNVPLVDWSSADVSFVPRLGMEETDEKIILTAELPGLLEKDVDVQIEKDVLTIKGEKKEEKSGQEGSRYFNERHYGAFERSIRLSSAVDKEKISAKFENGILHVTLPKTPEAKKEVKKIPIKH